MDKSKTAVVVGSALSFGGAGIILFRIVASIMKIRSLAGDTGMGTPDAVVQDVASTYTTCVFAAIISVVGVCMILAARRLGEAAEDPGPPPRPDEEWPDA